MQIFCPRDTADVEGGGGCVFGCCVDFAVRIPLRVGLVSGTSSFIYSIAGGDEAIKFFQA